MQPAGRQRRCAHRHAHPHPAAGVAHDGRATDPAADAHADGDAPAHRDHRRARRHAPSATPTEPPLPTEEVSGLPATPADVLITDNFDVPSLEWYAYADDASSSGQEGGIYFVSMNVNGRWTWRLGPVNSATKDIVIQADARLANDDPGGVYGFICRYDSATQSFYNFALTGDSRYRIARVNNGGDWTFLMDFGEPSPVVNPATQWNQIEVGCVSETLWLRVNGVMLASVNDAALANTGDFGFWAQTRGGAPQARAEYDFLTVRALAP
ncbi:MAG: hypothetical protein M5R40_22010 [Anaerolineae bacterium]|nr:hypothetical protein [Anaerolineae bacterium]